MGSCMSEGPTGQRPPNPRPLNYNPIQQIVNEFSIEKLREKWNRNQLNIIENKISAFEKNHIVFEDFCQLFPKIRHFKQTTQHKIYQLFAYEGNKCLSKSELINSLTLIRKVTLRADFAPFIFYVYTQDPKHEKITTDQFALFEQENRSYLEEEAKSETELEKTAEIKNEQNVQQANGDKKSVKVKMGFKRFKQVFERYSLKAYQHLFSWDLTEDEKELVGLLQKEGMQRKKGERVFLLEIQWFLEWKAYVEHKFKTFIEIDDLFHPLSKVSRKSKRPSTTAPADQHLRIEPPGEIKNYILKGSRLEGQLAENMRVNINFVCLSEAVWVRLVALYRGGPPIERIYPKIYDNTILKVFLDSFGKFIPKKMERYTSTDYKFVIEYANDFEEENRCLCFYKYPGKSNWIHLKKPEQAESEDIFNCPRTYLLFVLPQYAKKFDLDYNIQEERKEQKLKRRLRNYGAEVNVSIQGVLTRAEVVEIIDEEQIVVQYIEESGKTQRQTFKIDQKLRHLNPENLSSENQLNQLSGLTNIGNTCYMNAVLQCLLRTPSFGGYLQKENFNTKDEDLLLQELANIWQQSKNNNHETISTKTFKKMFDKHCPFFEGNSQHDAQEFLICLLSRISEEIEAKRTEYGQRQSLIVEEKNINKKVVKFFSGQTEATTECLKCKNKGIRKQPFFTYSVSLPEHSDVQYSYFLVEKDSKQPVPVRFGITLHRKTTIEEFLAAVCKRHGKKEDNIFLYSVFNNELLNRLDAHTFQKEIAHHLNFNTQLVLFQVQYHFTPTFDDYRLMTLGDKSVKIELRQRIYSSKTSDYKIVHLPYLLEIKEKMTWKDVNEAIANLINRGNENANEAKKRETIQASNNSYFASPLRVSEIKLTSNSRDTNAQGDHNQRSTIKEGKTPTLLSKLSSPGDKDNQDQKAPIYKQNVDYKVRVIKSDHYYENNCVFCKEEFVLDSKSRRKQICKDCGFESNEELFKSTQFRNINDNIIVAVDWLNSIPNAQQFVSDPSYELSQAKSVNRRDRLEDLLVTSANSRENLDLRCEKAECKFEQAARWQRIIVAPNILLLHFKRFTYEDNMLLKLTNNVVYPHQLTLPGTTEKYELYGSVVHIGSGVGGHYISYVKVAQKWYRCDDSKVTLASAGQEIDPNAYLLFYKKVDFEPSLICLSF